MCVCLYVVEIHIEGICTSIGLVQEYTGVKAYWRQAGGVTEPLPGGKESDSVEL